MFVRLLDEKGCGLTCAAFYAFYAYQPLYRGKPAEVQACSTERINL